MTASLARHALRMYPLAYRRRYGEEMAALLEDQPPDPRAVLDLLIGALRAHMRPGYARGAVDARERVRLSASGILLCWVFFAAAGFAYYKTTEDLPFSTAGHAHPVLRDAHLAVQALALIATATVLLGALPLILSALARARHSPSMRRLVARPFRPILLFGALTAAFIAVAHVHGPNHPTDVGGALAVAWGIAGLACGTACVLRCRTALFSTPAPVTWLRTSLKAGTLVTLAMLSIALATAIYTIALAADAPALAAEANGPFQVLSVTASLIVQVAVMVGAATLAAVATLRGWSVENQMA
jgi:hypothetical protein